MIATDRRTPQQALAAAIDGTILGPSTIAAAGHLVTASPLGVIRVDGRRIGRWSDDTALLAARVRCRGVRPARRLRPGVGMNGVGAAIELCEGELHAHEKHLRVTARSAPDHRPCEFGARAKFAERILRLLRRDQNSRQPHFELAHTDAGWTTRLKKNGRTILSSGKQCYARRAGAERAADIADPERRFARVVVDERGQS